MSRFRGGGGRNNAFFQQRSSSVPCGGRDILEHAFQQGKKTGTVNLSSKNIEVIPEKYFDDIELPAAKISLSFESQDDDKFWEITPVQKVKPKLYSKP